MNLNTIKIGALLPLSGKNFRYGQWIKEALELAKQKINLQNGINGKKLEVIYQDDSANPKKAILGMKKLNKEINAPIIFGSWASSSVTAQIPLAKKTKTIILAEAIAPKMENTGGFIFRIQSEAEYYLKKLATFVYFDLKIKKLAIFYIKNDFGDAQAKIFKTLFENLGGKIIYTDNFKQNETNFLSKLPKIKKFKPKAIFIPAYTEIADILIQAKQLKINSTFLASVTFENSDILTKAKKAAEGIIYPYHYAPDPQNDIDAKFRKKYRLKYKRDPEGFAALAYDGLNIIAKVLSNWDGKNSETLKEEFYRLYYYGVMGEIIFDEIGYPIKKVLIKTVKNGKFVKVLEKIDKLYFRRSSQQLLPPKYYQD